MYRVYVDRVLRLYGMKREIKCDTLLANYNLCKQCYYCNLPLIEIIVNRNKHLHQRCSSAKNGIEFVNEMLAKLTNILIFKSGTFYRLVPFNIPKWSEFSEEKFPNLRNAEIESNETKCS